MYYNYIMLERTSSEPSFLFKQPQQQSHPLEQLIIRKKEATYHNYLITIQNNMQNIPTSHNPPFKHQGLNTATTIVKVEPVKETSQYPFDQSSQLYILHSSQISQTNSYFESVRSHKDQISTAQNKDKTNRHQQELFQETELSPLSSIRKLFKEISSDLTDEVQKYEPKTQFINLKTVETEIKLMEQEDQEVQWDNEGSSIKYKFLHSNTLYDLINFAVIKSKMIRCLVKMTNNHFFSLQSIYDVYLYEEKRHLLRAKKKRYRFSTYFDVIGKDKNQVQSFAKVKSNLSRSQYKLLQFKKDTQFSERCSQKPFSSRIIKASPVYTEEQQLIEKQDCYLSYQPNFLGLQQQRLILIKSKKNVVKSERFSDLKNCYQNCEYQRFQKFTTRLAEKNREGKLVLDLKQKSLQDSAKNMIIEDQHGQAVLMFAKMKDDFYILNVMHPFNILEGFFLALCNLDRKILNT